MRSFFIPAVFVIGLFLSGPVLAGEAVYILFRHAEKMIDGHDPELSYEGKKRALSISKYLEQAGVSRIFSSDYQRTRETVAPVSAMTGIPIEIYDPRNLEDFAQELKKMSGTIAVSGHSNTTPELAALISGEITKPMPETEYDRLYIIRRTDGGEYTIKVSRQESGL